MVPAAAQKPFKRGESRLFETIWLAVHLTDAMALAGLAMRGKLDIADEKQAMRFACAGFPFEIFLPIVHPMKLTVANKRFDEITLEIKPKHPAPVDLKHNIAEFPQMYNRLVGIFYLRFYEQHHPHIQSRYGRDTKAWPQIFRFARAIRNGIVPTAVASISKIQITRPSHGTHIRIRPPTTANQSLTNISMPLICSCFYSTYRTS